MLIGGLCAWNNTQIAELEAEKKAALANEDYDKASEIKRQIEAIRNEDGRASGEDAAKVTQ